VAKTTKTSYPLTLYEISRLIQDCPFIKLQAFLLAQNPPPPPLLHSSRLFVLLPSSVPPLLKVARYSDVRSFHATAGLTSIPLKQSLKGTPKNKFEVGVSPSRRDVMHRRSQTCRFIFRSALNVLLAGEKRFIWASAVQPLLRGYDLRLKTPRGVPNSATGLARGTSAYPGLLCPHAPTPTGLPNRSLCGLRLTQDGARRHSLGNPFRCLRQRRFISRFWACLNGVELDLRRSTGTVFAVTVQVQVRSVVSRDICSLVHKDCPLRCCLRHRSGLFL
jgi:hypothetical protein